MSSLSATIVRGRRALLPIGDEAHGEARLLLAHVLQCGREWLFAHDDSSLTAVQEREYLRLCTQRAEGRPLAYIIGTAWFYGRAFVVNERVLIPRPETELLVEETIEHLRARTDVVSVLDIGTGSGAIACSIAAELPTAIVEGTDISEDALEIARLNAQRLAMAARCTFRVGDMAKPVGAARFDVVTANLPYIPTADVPVRPNPVGFEPRLALDGGADGLLQYRRFMPMAPKLLLPGGLLLLETAPPVADNLVKLAAAALPRADVSVRSDYASRARCLRVQT